MKINFIIFLLIKCFYVDNADAKSVCKKVIIDGIYYDEEVLIRRLDRPINLAVDYATNTLFFSHNTVDRWVTAALNLETKEYSMIVDDLSSISQSVNQETHEVYLGGNEGLFKFSQNDKELELFGQQGSFVWYVYFKDIIFFILHPSAKVYTFENGRSKAFDELKDVKAYRLVIDNDNDIIFNNEHALYIQRIGSDHRIEYPDSLNIRTITTDVYGKAYVGRADGVYIIDKSRTVLKNIVEVRDLFGLIFDGYNNIIYSDGSKIVRLTRNEYGQCPI